MYSKHIKKHADKIAEGKLKEHLKFYAEHIPNSYDKQNTTEAKEQYLKDSSKYYGAELTRIKNALLKGRFYAGVKSVSQSRSSICRDSSKCQNIFISDGVQFVFIYVSKGNNSAHS